MDFKWLHTFVTAAKYENFRKTAETLFLSQPTVTVHT
ncbi:helix-turn-helix domain-containing protein, partial [Bacillus sp. S10C12M]|nr:LysR family transcriptional regulator [Bacillus sp. S10C12M]